MNVNLRHIALIIRREYLERLRSPGFIIGSIIGVLAIVALSFLPLLLSLLDRQNTQHIALIDPHRIVAPYLRAAGATASTDLSGAVSAASATATPSVDIVPAETANEAALSESVRAGKLSGYVVVSGDDVGTAKYALHMKERPNALIGTRLQQMLDNALIVARLRANNLSTGQIQTAFALPHLEVLPIVGGTLRDPNAEFQLQALVYFLLVLLYGTMVMYGVQVAMGVVFEKSSRVMEVLITSVKPLELMIGKVLGIGLLGLTQYTFWLVAGAAAYLFKGSDDSATGVGLPISSTGIVTVPPATLIYFLVFFVLGYLVYASIYAALGSLVNKAEDVNSITTPVTLLMVATYLLSLASLGNPDALYVRWLAFIPFLSPMLMFIRVSLGTYSWWEPALAIALLLLAMLFFSWLAAKIYRVGVLLYGKRPTFREIGRLLRAP